MFDMTLEEIYPYMQAQKSYLWLDGWERELTRMLTFTWWFNWLSSDAYQSSFMRTSSMALLGFFLGAVDP